MRCNICPFRCNLQDGKVGRCGVRLGAQESETEPLTYGEVSFVALESIRKRPIFDYKPDALLLTLGSVGCNLKCLYCQNYDVSQISALEYTHFVELPPDNVITLAMKHRADGVAFSYNEPLIAYEYVRDVFRLAKQDGFITALSTNGYFLPHVIEEVAPVTDAVNIDIKAFNNNTYRKLTGATLDPVLRAVEIFMTRNTHVELTYLVIPGYNDSERELRKFARWVVSVGNPPVHLPRFFPHYLLKAPEGTKEQIHAVAEILREEGVEKIHGGWEEHFGVLKF